MKFPVSIFILLFLFKICIASKMKRKSNVGYLIKTQSGKLFLQHSKKTKSLHQPKKMKIDRSIGGNDYQFAGDPKKTKIDRDTGGNDYQFAGDTGKKCSRPSENKSTEPNGKRSYYKTKSLTNHLNFFIGPMCTWGPIIG